MLLLRTPWPYFSINYELGNIFQGSRQQQWELKTRVAIMRIYQVPPPRLASCESLSLSVYAYACSNPPLNPLLHLNSELNLNKVKLWHNELAARQQQSQVRIMKGLKVKRSSLCQRERVTNLISSVFYF